MALYEIVCPDGLVRHLPYHNEEDAIFDAGYCEKQTCDLYPNDAKPHGKCSGGAHTVRLCTRSRI